VHAAHARRHRTSWPGRRRHTRMGKKGLDEPFGGGPAPLRGACGKEERGKKGKRAGYLQLPRIHRIPCRVRPGTEPRKKEKKTAPARAWHARRAGAASRAVSLAQEGKRGATAGSPRVALSPGSGPFRCVRGKRKTHPPVIPRTTSRTSARPSLADQERKEKGRPSRLPRTVLLPQMPSCRKSNEKKRGREERVPPSRVKWPAS